MDTHQIKIMRQIINKLFVTSFLACMMVGCMFFTACEEEADTTPVLKVFGPSPALRGGQLEFIGLNLDQVTSVVLPENIEVTDITYVGTSKIIINIPQEAKPGYVTLKTSSKEIKTITQLSFSEPITFNTISPVKFKAGEKVTIEGDYLNLIKEVIFNDGIVIESKDFISQTRKKIEVTVPVEAQSGKVIISNGEEIPILVYSDIAVDVTLPTIASVSPNPVKPGQTFVLNGTDLDLVKSVKLEGGLTVDNVSVNSEKTSLSLLVPAEAKEGKFFLVCYSGVEVESSVKMMLVAPVITKINPNPVKNGKDLTITGTDLDLASSVVFTTATGTKEGSITSQSPTSLVVSVPDEASEGVVTVNAKSGKTGVSEVLDFVKPGITSVTPTTLMAGNEITITGKNLDLVSKILFKDDLSVDVINSDENTLKVNTPTAAVSGTFTLVAKNGDKVVSEQELTLEAANKPVVTEMTSPIKPGALLTIKGTKLHLVESVIFQNNVKATSYGNRTPTSLEVYVPQTAKVGKVTVKLLTYDNQEVISPEFTISGTDPITAATKMIMDFQTRSTSDWHAPDWDNWGGSYDAAKAKADGYLTLVARPGWWVFGCNHADPNGGWPSVSTSDYVFKVDIKTEKPIKLTGGYEFIFMIGGENLTSQLIVEDGCIATPGNEWTTLTIPISGLSNPTLTSGNFGIVLNWSDAGIDFSGLCFDNMRFDPK